MFLGAERLRPQYLSLPNGDSTDYGLGVESAVRPVMYHSHVFMTGRVALMPLRQSEHEPVEKYFLLLKFDLGYAFGILDRL
jgi:hypothetical protein